MPSLVEQIQRDACSDKVRVSAILRQMKVAAFKLNLDNVESWVDLELNGYGERDVPHYRQIPGHLRAWNPYNGWIPVVGDIVQKIDKIHISQSINSVEDLLQGGPDGNLSMEVNSRLSAILDRGSSIAFGRYQWKLGRSNVVNIVDYVRNLALDWSIALQRRGITGEGLGFSEEEKNLAQNSGSSITFGDNATVIGNLGQGNQSGNISSAALDTQAVLAFVKQLLSHESSLASQGIDDTRVSELANAIQSECKKPAPNIGIVRAALVDLRNTMSGAAGSLIASGVIATINAILGG